jgi:hypothetical protein
VVLGAQTVPPFTSAVVKNVVVRISPSHDPEIVSVVAQFAQASISMVGAVQGRPPLNSEEIP